MSNIVPKVNDCSTADLNNWRESLISKIDNSKELSENPMYPLVLATMIDQIINNVKELMSMESKIRTHADLIIKLYDETGIRYGAKVTNQKHPSFPTQLKPFNIIPEFGTDTTNVGEWMKCFICNIENLFLELNSCNGVSNINRRVDSILPNINIFVHMLKTMSIHSELLEKLCDKTSVGFEKEYPSNVYPSLQDILYNVNDTIPKFTGNSKDDLNSWRETFIQNLICWHDRSNILNECLSEHQFILTLGKMSQFPIVKGNFIANGKLLSKLNQTVNGYEDDHLFSIDLVTKPYTHD